jgi:hypothetical protein
MRQYVRVVKEEDSKSSGLGPRRFESCYCRVLFILLSSQTNNCTMHVCSITYHTIQYTYLHHGARRLSPDRAFTPPRWLSKNIWAWAPRRGIEPRSPAWQAGILATILSRKLKPISKVWFSESNPLSIDCENLLFRSRCPAGDLIAHFLARDMYFFGHLFHNLAVNRSI